MEFFVRNFVDEESGGEVEIRLVFLGLEEKDLVYEFL